MLKQGTDLKSNTKDTNKLNYESIGELCDTSIEVIKIRENRYLCKFYLNSKFFGVVIGTKGVTLKNLEARANTTITIPRDDQSSEIMITGPNQKNIMEARCQIYILFENSRSKLRFTHFISIPAIFEEMIENFKKFKNDILQNCNKNKPIKEEFFQKPEKLHLTVAMLILLNNEDQKRVIEALEICKNDIIMPALEKSGPITIEYRGVDIMNDNPSKVNILYIKVHDETGQLQKISNDIANYFIDQGLSRRERDNVTLHITAINTSYIKDDGVSYYNRKKEAFDSSYILKNYNDTYFGKTILSNMELSILSKTKREDGYYLTAGKIEFS